MARKKKLPRNVQWDPARGQYYVILSQKCEGAPPERARVKWLKNRRTGVLEPYVVWQHYCGPELRDAVRYRDAFRRRMGWDRPRRRTPARIPTVEQAWMEFVASPEFARYAYGTQRDYKLYAKYWMPYVGSFRVTDVELRALEKYYATTTGRGVLRRTALKWLAPLAVLLNSSVVRQRIPDHLRYELQNPVDVFRRGLPKQRTKRDRAKERQRPLTAEEARRVLEANDLILAEAEAEAELPNGRRAYQAARNHHLVTLFRLFTGARPAEAAGLPWCCVHLRERRIELRWSRPRDFPELERPKTGQTREVDIDTELAQLLQAHREHLLATGRYRGPDSPVFPGFSQSNYRNRWWVPLLRRAGVEYRTPYQLRHTFATLLLNATQELAGVSAALGHADTEITARVYAEARRSATDYAATVRRVVEEDR